MSNNGMNCCILNVKNNKIVLVFNTEILNAFFVAFYCTYSVLT